MAQEVTKKRLLVFIVAYNAAKTIEGVITRIPQSLGELYDVEVLVIDDCSKDQTFEASETLRRAEGPPFRLNVLFNPVNQGYGGNQKIGFAFAVEQGFDFVALLHGDGQYAPECLPELVKPLADGEAEAVFGSRILRKKGALKGGMPLYKLVGNRILTWFQNKMLHSQLSEFHSGYRVYSVEALRRIPFELNAQVFHFDTEIIIQLLFAGLRIKEVPIPTYYGDEICHVNGLKYAWDVAFATLKARLQKMSLFYDRKFDCQPSEQTSERYNLKLGFESSHTLTLAKVRKGARVLDLGCARGYLGMELRRRGCYVTGIDLFPLDEGVELDAFYQRNLNTDDLPVPFEDFDHVLLLDLIEHLLSPEEFVDKLRRACRYSPDMKLIVSTGNVGFVITRLMLLLGQFNYGRRGILDLTHTRLFTFRTFCRIFEQAGFEVIETRGIPAPIPLALGDGRFARLLLAMNRALIRLSKSLFSYQIFIVLKPRPSLPYLLQKANIHSKIRAEKIDNSSRET